MNNIKNKIKEFELQCKNVVISYGGDGTLLETFHKNSDKSIIPIRDYGCCEKHKYLLDEVLNGDKHFKKSNSIFRLKLGDLIETNDDYFHDIKAMSEAQIISANPTQCLRFDVFVNNKLFMENVIANGFICATTIGSTGYFKSVARTIFREGFGLAFICPTYGINNIILKGTDWIDIKFKRDCEAFISLDNITNKINIQKDDIKTFRLSCDHVSLFGYDMFMCPECRKGRNSTNINDKYIVI
jgi:NAD kinase